MKKGILTPTVRAVQLDFTALMLLPNLLLALKAITALSILAFLQPVPRAPMVTVLNLALPPTALTAIWVCSALSLDLVLLMVFAILATSARLKLPFPILPMELLVTYAQQEVSVKKVPEFQAAALQVPTTPQPVENPSKLAQSATLASIVLAPTQPHPQETVRPVITVLQVLM